jgi:hypothetical protein
MYAIDTDNGKSMVKILWLYFVMFATEVFFAVFGKTRRFLGNPDTPIERSKKNVFKKRRLMLWFKRYNSMNMINFVIMLFSQRWIC